MGIRLCLIRVNSEKGLPSTLAPPTHCIVLQVTLPPWQLSQARLFVIFTVIQFRQSTMPKGCHSSHLSTVVSTTGSSSSSLRGRGRGWGRSRGRPHSTSTTTPLQPPVQDEVSARSPRSTTPPSTVDLSTPVASKSLEQLLDIISGHFQAPAPAGLMDGGQQKTTGLTQSNVYNFYTHITYFLRTWCITLFM